MAKRGRPPAEKPPEGRIRVSWDKKNNKPTVDGAAAGMANWLMNEIWVLTSNLQDTHGFDPKTLKFQIDPMPPLEPEKKKAEPAPISTDFLDDNDNVVV